MGAARVHTIACVAALVFIAAYVFPLTGHSLELWYMPLDRAWVLGAKPPGIGMDWYGRTLVASLTSALAAGGAALATRGSTRTTAWRGWSVLLGVAVVAALGAYGSALWDRTLGP